VSPATPTRPAGGGYEEAPRQRRSLFAVTVATTLMSAVLYFLHSLHPRHSINLWATTGAAGAVILALGLWASGRRILPRLGIGPRHPRHGFAASLGIGLAAGAVMVAATHVGFRLLEGPFPALAPLVERLYAELQAPPGPVAALPVVVLVVLAEEVLWRSVLIDMIRPRLGTLGTLVLATAVYSIPQMVAADGPLLAAAVGGGAVWSALYLWRRDLVAPFACHLVWDVVIFVVWPLV
jgi:CAAX protease family protein